VRGRPASLPFVRDAVSTNRRLSRTVERAFRTPLDSLAVDDLLVELAEGLLEAERGHPPAVSRRVDDAAVARAREFLEAEKTRVVRSSELEAITGLTRYDLARQFRIRFGTSPYRYLVMRRLALARDLMQQHRRLAEVAVDAGFADQAHFTRGFKAAFGLTPSRYRALSARAQAGIASAVRRRTSGAPAASSHARVDS
jgi:AraC-like DNA-binding protein